MIDLNRLTRTRLPTLFHFCHKIKNQSDGQRDKGKCKCPLLRVGHKSINI